MENVLVFDVELKNLNFVSIKLVFFSLALKLFENCTKLMKAKKQQRARWNNAKIPIHGIHQHLLLDPNAGSRFVELTRILYLCLFHSIMRLWEREIFAIRSINQLNTHTQRERETNGGNCKNCDSCSVMFSLLQWKNQNHNEYSRYSKFIMRNKLSISERRKNKSEEALKKNNSLLWCCYKTKTAKSFPMSCEVFLIFGRRHRRRRRRRCCFFPLFFF